MRPMPSWQSVKRGLLVLDELLEGKEHKRDEAVEASRNVTQFAAYVWRASYHLSEGARRVVRNGT